jgi:hypothetical protein
MTNLHAKSKAMARQKEDEVEEDRVVVRVVVQAVMVVFIACS